MLKVMNKRSNMSNMPFRKSKWIGYRVNVIQNIEQNISLHITIHIKLDSSHCLSILYILTCHSICNGNNILSRIVLVKRSTHQNINWSTEWCQISLTHFIHIFSLRHKCSSRVQCIFWQWVSKFFVNDLKIKMWPAWKITVVSNLIW